MRLKKPFYTSRNPNGSEQASHKVPDQGIIDELSPLERGIMEALQISPPLVTTETIAAYYKLPVERVERILRYLDYRGLLPGDFQWTTRRQSNRSGDHGPRT